MYRVEHSHYLHDCSLIVYQCTRTHSPTSGQAREEDADAASVWTYGYQYSCPLRANFVVHQCLRPEQELTLVPISAQIELFCPLCNPT